MAGKRTNTRHQERRRGFLVMDAVFGLVVGIVVLMGISVAVLKQAQAEKRLANVRAACRQAETAMLMLQTSGERPEAGVSVDALTDTAPPGEMWVRVTVPASGTGNLAVPAETLVGLVPVKFMMVKSDVGGRP